MKGGSLMGVYELFFCEKCQDLTVHHLHVSIFRANYFHCITCNSKKKIAKGKYV